MSPYLFGGVGGGRLEDGGGKAEGEVREELWIECKMKLKIIEN